MKYTRKFECVALLLVWGFQFSIQQCTRSICDYKENQNGLLREDIDAQQEFYKEMNQNLQAMKEVMDKKIDEIINITEQIKINTQQHQSDQIFPSCKDAYQYGRTISGLFRAYSNYRQVFCDQTTAGGGWLVIQRRIDGQQLFNQTWILYEHGFGNPEREFWIGNKLLSQVTQNIIHMARFEITDWDGRTRYAEYSRFLMAGPEDKYRLTISGYNGTAGDSMSYHNGIQFSTVDQDNDGGGGRCTSNHGLGGWWYDNCDLANLNAEFGQSIGDKGIEWSGWKGSHSFKSSTMMIKPIY